jgi:hypothetical protein
MIIIDRMIIGGIRFVLGKVAAAVDQELNDDTSLREQLLAAQMQVELGEMSQEQFEQLEADILLRLREIHERRTGGAPSPLEFKVTGADAQVTFDVEPDPPPEDEK